MMRHPDSGELGQFAAGKLAAGRLLEIDAHVSGCAECRAAMASLPAVRKAASDLGTVLLGAGDCPEYERLSAYIEGELDLWNTSAIASHVNLCELCSRDVSRMAELRSHAAMRPAVTVGPGMSRRVAAPVNPLWRRVLAGTGIAAVLVVAAFSFEVLMRGPRSANVAKTPSNIGSPTEPIEPNSSKPPSVHGNIVPNTTPPSGTRPPTVVPVPSVPRPETVALLKDGNYQVVRRNGETYLAKTGPGAPRTALEARVAAAIDEKLRTGAIRPEKQVRLAMNAITVRNGDSHPADPTAPELISPVAKMLIADRPTLKWSAVDQADSYRVQVYDDQNNLIFTQTTDLTSMTLPTSLARGRVYKWQVGVRFSEVDRWADSNAVKFGVISDEDYASINRLRREMSGSHLALGAAYESFGLTDEAGREYAAVRAANPHSRLAGKLR